MNRQEQETIRVQLAAEHRGQAREAYRKEFEPYEAKVGVPQVSFVAGSLMGDVWLVDDIPYPGKVGEAIARLECEAEVWRTKYRGGCRLRDAANTRYY